MPNDTTRNGHTDTTFRFVDPVTQAEMTFDIRVTWQATETSGGNRRVELEEAYFHSVGGELIRAPSDIEDAVKSDERVMEMIAFTMDCEDLPPLVPITQAAPAQSHFAGP